MQFVQGLITKTCKAQAALSGLVSQAGKPYLEDRIKTVVHGGITDIIERTFGEGLSLRNPASNKPERSGKKKKRAGLGSVEVTPARMLKEKWLKRHLGLLKQQAADQCRAELEALQCAHMNTHEQRQAYQSWLAWAETMVDAAVRLHQIRSLSYQVELGQSERFTHTPALLAWLNQRIGKSVTREHHIELPEWLRPAPAYAQQEYLMANQKIGSLTQQFRAIQSSFERAGVPSVQIGADAEGGDELDGEQQCDSETMRVLLNTIQAYSPKEQPWRSYGKRGKRIYQDEEEE